MRRGEQGERFDNQAVYPNLALCWPEKYQRPFWRLRYRFAGRQCKMLLGHVDVMSLKQALDETKLMMADITRGIDVASVRQERKREAQAKHAAAQNRHTVAALVNDFLARHIEGKRKDAKAIRQRLENHVIPTLGKMNSGEVKPRHIDAILLRIVDQGSPAMANSILDLLKRLFNYAIKLHIVESNPAIAFTRADAGGQIHRREFYLTREKLTEVLAAIPQCRSFSRHSAPDFAIFSA